MQFCYLPRKKNLKLSHLEKIWSAGTLKFLTKKIENFIQLYVLYNFIKLIILRTQKNFYNN